MQTVQVCVIPVSDVAILHLGQDQGFFEERGIRLESNLGQGGAALCPPSSPASTPSASAASCRSCRRASRACR
ncbi:hypothetical protein ACI782_02165 [Geodermatophilus sp. SYSU D00703]